MASGGSLVHFHPHSILARPSVPLQCQPFPAGPFRLAKFVQHFWTQRCHHSLRISVNGQVQVGSVKSILWHRQSIPGGSRAKSSHCKTTSFHLLRSAKSKLELRIPVIHWRTERLHQFYRDEGSGAPGLRTVTASVVTTRWQVAPARSYHFY